MTPAPILCGVLLVGDPDYSGKIEIEIQLTIGDKTYTGNILEVSLGDWNRLVSQQARAGQVHCEVQL